LNVKEKMAAARREEAKPLEEEIAQSSRGAESWRR
jgi:hypothetical protein